MTTPAPAPRRRTKALVAGSLGVLLLAAGGGTFAAWQDSTTIPGAKMTSGELSITAGKGVWTDKSDQEVDIANRKLVPGDTLTYSNTVDVKLEGENLQANLTGNFPTLSQDGDNDELLKALDVVLTVNEDVVSDAALPGNGYPVSGSGTYAVTLDVTFNPDKVTGIKAQNQSVQLEDVEIVLEQVLPGA